MVAPVSLSSDALRCDTLVVGAGLAGAAVAWVLARRGQRVLVLDQAADPASGASALPVGLSVPHQSKGPSLLTPLTAWGNARMRAALQAMGSPGDDHAVSGVVTALVGIEKTVINSIACAGQAGTAPAHPQARWHAHALWIKPAAVVRRWLDQPGITWRGNSLVAQLRRDPGIGPRMDGAASTPHWQAVGGDGQVQGEAPRVVLATAWQTPELLRRLPGAHAALISQLILTPVRGSLSWGLHHDLPPALSADLPTVPVNGHGSLIAHIPSGSGSLWALGATFDRERTSTELTDDEVHAQHTANQARLSRLLPELLHHAAGTLANARHARLFTGVRCTVPDRLPLVGPVPAALAADTDGLWLSVGMGTRGLTLALLCADLLAAQALHEALPIPEALAAALSPARWIQR